MSRPAAAIMPEDLKKTVLERARSFGNEDEVMKDLEGISEDLKGAPVHSRDSASNTIPPPPSDPLNTPKRTIQNIRRRYASIQESQAMDAIRFFLGDNALCLNRPECDEYDDLSDVIAILRDLDVSSMQAPRIIVFNYRESEAKSYPVLINLDRKDMGAVGYDFSLCGADVKRVLEERFGGFRLLGKRADGHHGYDVFSEKGDNFSLVINAVANVGYWLGGGDDNEEGVLKKLKENCELVLGQKLESTSGSDEEGNALSDIKRDIKKALQDKEVLQKFRNRVLCAAKIEKKVGPKLRASSRLIKFLKDNNQQARYDKSVSCFEKEELLLGSADIESQLSLQYGYRELQEARLFASSNALKVESFSGDSSSIGDFNRSDAVKKVEDEAKVLIRNRIDGLRDLMRYLSKITSSNSSESSRKQLLSEQAENLPNLFKELMESGFEYFDVQQQSVRNPNLEGRAKWLKEKYNKKRQEIDKIRSGINNKIPSFRYGGAEIKDIAECVESFVEAIVKCKLSDRESLEDNFHQCSELFEEFREKYLQTLRFVQKDVDSKCETLEKELSKKADDKADDILKKYPQQDSNFAKAIRALMIARQSDSLVTKREEKYWRDLTDNLPNIDLVGDVEKYFAQSRKVCGLENQDEIVQIVHECIANADLSSDGDKIACIKSIASEIKKYEERVGNSIIPAPSDLLVKAMQDVIKNLRETREFREKSNFEKDDFSIEMTDKSSSITVSVFVEGGDCEDVVSFQISPEGKIIEKDQEVDATSFELCNPGVLYKARRELEALYLKHDLPRISKSNFLTEQLQESGVMYRGWNGDFAILPEDAFGFFPALDDNACFSITIEDVKRLYYMHEGIGLMVSDSAGVLHLASEKEVSEVIKVVDDKTRQSIFDCVSERETGRVGFECKPDYSVGIDKERSKDGVTIYRIGHSAIGELRSQSLEMKLRMSEVSRLINGAVYSIEEIKAQLYAATADIPALQKKLEEEQIKHDALTREWSVAEADDAILSLKLRIELLNHDIALGKDDEAVEKATEEKRSLVNQLSVATIVREIVHKKYEIELISLEYEKTDRSIQDIINKSLLTTDVNLRRDMFGQLRDLELEKLEKIKEVLHKEEEKDLFSCVARQIAKANNYASQSSTTKTNSWKEKFGKDAEELFDKISRRKIEWYELALKKISEYANGCLEKMNGSNNNKDLYKSLLEDARLRLKEVHQIIADYSNNKDGLKADFLKRLEQKREDALEERGRQISKGATPLSLEQQAIAEVQYDANRGETTCYNVVGGERVKVETRELPEFCRRFFDHEHFNKNKPMDKTQAILQGLKANPLKVGDITPRGSADRISLIGKKIDPSGEGVPIVTPANLRLSGKSCKYAEFGGIVFNEAGFDERRIFGNADLFMANFRGCSFVDVDFSAIPKEIFDTISFTKCKFDENCIFPPGAIKESSIGAAALEKLGDSSRQGKLPKVEPLPKNMIRTVPGKDGAPSTSVRVTDAMSLTMERLRTTKGAVR